MSLIYDGTTIKGTFFFHSDTMFFIFHNLKRGFRFDRFKDGLWSASVRMKTESPFLKALFFVLLRLFPIFRWYFSEWVRTSWITRAGSAFNHVDFSGIATETWQSRIASMRCFVWSTGTISFSPRNNNLPSSSFKIPFFPISQFSSESHASGTIPLFFPVMKSHTIQLFSPNSYHLSPPVFLN